MIQELNKLEFSILERVAIKYPFVKEHLPFLRVNSRVSTGVGMYINFIYVNLNNKELKVDIENLAISTNETIKLDGLKYGLCYEIDVTDGKLSFIELVTYGEEWNGVIPDNFTFVP